MIRHLVPTAIGLAMIAATAPAQYKDQTGYRAIAAGDFAAAERMLVAERRIFPDRPELMLNLAVVYSRTGRTDDARALYARVLERPAKELEMPSGRAAWSHDLARTALASLDPVVTIATR